MTQDLFKSKKKTRENKTLCANNSFTLCTYLSTKPKRFFSDTVTAGLYTIVCTKTGCVYVGESDNVLSRLNAHKTKLRKNFHDNLKLQADFNQYGETAFVWRRLYFGHGANKKSRLDLETLILSTLSPNERYNVYSNWRKRARESNPFFGKKHSDESLAAIRDSKRGKVSTFLGKKQCNDVKELISKHNANGGTRKKALYIDDVFYESILEASEITGTTRKIIRQKCHSNEIRFAHYRWADAISTTKDPVKVKTRTEGAMLSLQSPSVKESKGYATKGWQDECSEDVKLLLEKINGNIDLLFSLIASETPELQKKIVSSIGVKVEHFRTE